MHSTVTACHTTSITADVFPSFLLRNYGSLGLKMATNSGKRREVLEAKEAFEVVQEISKLINTGLDDETLSICLKLCENGVNPEALALAIKELRKEASKLKIMKEEK